MLELVVFIDRNVISEQREQEKKNTAVKLQKNTANTYKSTISQDNNHQAKFKLTQEKNEMTVSIIHRQNQMTYTTDYINFSQVQHNQQRAMLEKDTVTNSDRM